LNHILEALPGEQVLQSNAVATVTTNCLIVENRDHTSRTIIPITDIADVKRSETTYPGLLVVAAAFFLLCAACFCSKQGPGTAVPLGTLGLLFVLGYLGYRKASLTFIDRTGFTPTPEGNPSEAASIQKLVARQIPKSSAA
jgi:hypothetical protein